MNNCNLSQQAKVRRSGTLIASLRKEPDGESEISASPNILSCVCRKPWSELDDVVGYSELLVCHVRRVLSSSA